MNTGTLIALLLIFVVLGYCGNRLAEIATAVEDIQDRLRHVYPISKRERDKLADEAECLDGN